MLNVVIAMAGLSSRFARAGYTLPKYMLYAGGKSLFRLSVEGFVGLFEEARFIFVARDVYDTRRFIEEECHLMGVRKHEVVMLDDVTRGQAETVAVGLQRAAVADNDSLIVFNIDTFRPGFVLPAVASQGDGYLEVFRGEGANWSYARTAAEESTCVVETAEKREISHYCSTGLYHFSRVSDFKTAFDTYSETSSELYVAPMYNILIAQGKEIHINLIDREEVIFCGTPQEYHDYLKSVV